MHVTLHLTNACNLACGYCYECHQKDYMTAETAKRRLFWQPGKGSPPAASYSSAGSPCCAGM